MTIQINKPPHVPLDAWLRHPSNGPLRDQLFEALDAAEDDLYPVLSPEEVTDRLRRYL